MAWKRQLALVVILGMGSKGPAAAAGAAPVSQAALEAGQAELRAFQPPGAALAIIKDDRSSHATAGLERLPDGAAVSNETIFQIASLTKPFTAIAILRLAEQKRLDLDDAAAKWLDWLPPRYASVTIRQLLTHTSGVPRDLRRGNVDEFSLDEFRRRFTAADPSFLPGTRWEYSNTGYILLSLIGERAGRRSFGQLLDSLVFRPLGMLRTHYRAPLVQSRGRAAGYDWQDSTWKKVPAVYSGYGNSGVESTASDLARFAAGLHGRKLLNSKSYRQMLSPAVLNSGKTVEFPFRGAKSSYGLGWFLGDACGSAVATHGGTIAGFSSNLSWAVQRNVSAIALSNGKSGPDRIGVADKVAAQSLRAALGCPN